MNNSKFKSEIILGFHIALGFALSYFARLALIYSLGILIYGLYRLYLHRNMDEAAPMIAAYFVGSEVLLRLFSSTLSYEFAKYAAVLFLILGLMMGNEKREKPMIYILFIFLLLPSLLVIDFPTFNEARQMVSFNLSGPLCLGVSAIYFYKRRISAIQLRKIFLNILYPITTMTIVIYFRAGSLEEASFTTESNFQTSGGFGPNQVSTIFGLGITIIALAYFMNIRLFRIKYLDLFLMSAFLIRGLATFSRGGVLAPFVAVVLCVIIMTFTDKGFKLRVNNMVYALLVISIIGFLGFNYVNDVSGGLLEMRFRGESMYNPEKSNLYSGRDQILLEDLEIFEKNMVFGVGPGMGNKARGEISGEEISAT
ncbi:MAG: hypothetical protein IPL53_10290 [Ignavibacteria bacterium]|nr:hypothetical protein [Ignavibacteria bacterium]